MKPTTRLQLMKNTILISFALHLFGGAWIYAEDWPQWGGHDAGRNMYSPAKNLPDRFDPGAFKRGTEEIDLSTTTNVKWVAKLGSHALGNPTVANGRVFVGTNNETPRDPQHQKDRSILMCFNEETGEFLWQLVVPKLKSGIVNDYPGYGLFSSAKIEGDRVYLVTTRCEVLCLDVNGMANGNTGPYKDEAQYMVLDLDQPPATIGPKDADIIWRYDMMHELGVFPHNGSNCSPLIIGDRVYVNTSNGPDWSHINVPSPYSPSFIALNKQTGELEAEDDAGIGFRLLHGQWANPSAGHVNGRWLLFYGGGDGWCYAFDAEPVPGEDGESKLSTVWKLDCNPAEYRAKPYSQADGPSEIISTPVFYKNRVYVAIGQDPEHGEGVGNLVCIDATKEGDITQTGVIWSYHGIHRSMSTVSIDPETGLLFAADYSGYIHCLDADSGELHWIYAMKAHVWGSTLVADGKVYIGNQDGDFVILPARKDFDPKKEQPISETNLQAPIASTPIVANGVLYVASNTHLYAIQDPGSRTVVKDELSTVKLEKE
jgi:outer membrane protein assembly factor BamB